MKSPALIESTSGLVWSYTELDAEVALRAGALRSSGKTLLFHFCGNDLDSLAWYRAAEQSGTALALLNERMDGGLRSALLQTYRPDWVRSADFPGEEYAAAGTQHLWRRKVPDLSAIHPELGVLLSTSGSTGSPKFVRLTWRNLAANAESIREALAIGPADLPIAHLPIHYSYGLSVINSHLLAGCTIVLTNDALVTPAFWNAVRTYSVNSFSGVPYTYQMLRRLDLNKLNVPKIVTMTQAGGKLDPANTTLFHERMAERGGRFFVMYGQTEASARISILPSDLLPAKLGSAGRAIPGGQLSVLDDGTGSGELVYTGPNVMMGYANTRAELAAGDENGGTLHTGDRARLDEDGFVYILGRAARDAKVFGLRVNLDDLETMLKAHGPVAAVAASSRVVLFCEFGDQAQHARLREELCAKLRVHHSAFEFRRVEALATKATGKIDYEALVAGL